MYAFMLPSAILSYLIGLLAIVCWVAYRPRIDDGAVLTLEWRPWVAKRWRFSTTIFRTIFFHTAARNSLVTRQHELVHVRQAEDDAMTGLLAAIVVASTGHPIVALVLWTLWPATALLHYGAAAARWGSQNAYLDAENERSAYAQTDTVSGQSWCDRRDRARL